MTLKHEIPCALWTDVRLICSLPRGGKRKRCQVPDLTEFLQDTREFCKSHPRTFETWLDQGTANLTACRWQPCFEREAGPETFGGPFPPTLQRLPHGILADISLAHKASSGQICSGLPPWAAHSPWRTDVLQRGARSCTEHCAATPKHRSSSAVFSSWHNWVSYLMINIRIYPFSLILIKFEDNPFSHFFV